MTLGEALRSMDEAAEKMREFMEREDIDSKVYAEAEAHLPDIEDLVARLIDARLIQ